jgi:hypothetical protein
VRIDRRIRRDLHRFVFSDADDDFEFSSALCIPTRGDRVLFSGPRESVSSLFLNFSDRICSVAVSISHDTYRHQHPQINRLSLLAICIRPNLASTICAHALNGMHPK